MTGASPDRVVRQGQRDLLPAFVEGARLLEREGVRAITTNCGFLAQFQSELAASVSVPVFTSSLMLVPLVAPHAAARPGRGRDDRGRLVARARPTSPERGSTADMPVVVAGLETEKEFTRVLLDDQLEPRRGDRPRRST